MASNERTTQTMSATDARQHFASAINQVARQEAEIIVEKNGVPVAAIVSIEDYRRLKDQDAQRAAKFRIFNEMRATLPRIPNEELEREAAKALDEVRAEMRAERFEVMGRIRAAFAGIPEEELEREAKKTLDEVREEMQAERERSVARQG